MKVEYWPRSESVRRHCLCIYMSVYVYIYEDMYIYIYVHIHLLSVVYGVICFAYYLLQASAHK